IAAILISLIMTCIGGSAVRAAECEDLIARHMVGEALLAAALGRTGGKDRNEEYRYKRDSETNRREIRHWGILDHRFFGSCLLDQYRDRFHFQSGLGQAAPGIRFLAFDHRRQGYCGPRGAQARN